MNTPQPIEVTFASTNLHKLEEVQHWLDSRQLADAAAMIRILPPSNALDVVEDGKTFIENALIKAKAFAEVSHTRYILADDSGLVIPALSGLDGLQAFPGVCSNRWLTADREKALLTPLEQELPHYQKMNQGILRLMDGKTEREAYYVCALMLYDRIEQKEVFLTEGRLPLWVTEGTSEGTGGFGYDPIMHAVDGTMHIAEHTLATCSLDEKNAISHRGQALQALVDYFLK